MQALQTLTKPLLLYHRKHTLTRLGISSVLTRLRQTLTMVLTTEHIALRSHLLVCTPSLGVFLFQATTEDNTICWLLAMGIKYCYQQYGSTVTVSLKKYDQVWIKCLFDKMHIHVYGHYSSFSGWRLFLICWLYVYTRESLFRLMIWNKMYIISNFSRFILPELGIILLNLIITSMHC